MRKCQLCGNELPYKVTIDGKQRNLKNRKFCLTCSPFGQHNTRRMLLKASPGEKLELKKEQARLTTRRHRHNVKWKLIEYKGGVCRICGYDKKIPAAYNFHHINPSEKSFSVCRAYGKSWDDLVKEVDKCELLCCRCHAEVHAKLEEEAFRKRRLALENKKKRLRLSGSSSEK